MKKTIIKKLARTENILVKGAIMYLCPNWFLNQVYKLQEYGGCTLSVSFDIDYKEDIDALPWLLDKLNQYDIKASFACIGKLIESYPEEHKQILVNGHEILNHTYLHPYHDQLCRLNIYELDKNVLKSEISLCNDACLKYLNYQPRGFRLPHFGNIIVRKRLDWGLLYKYLRQLGYQYDSSVIGVKTKNFGAPFLTEQGILEIPLSGCPKHPFGVFDSYHAFRASKPAHTTPQEFYELFTSLLMTGFNTGSYINVYFDPQDALANESAFKGIFDLIDKARHKFKMKVMNYEGVADEKNSIK